MDLLISVEPRAFGSMPALSIAFFVCGIACFSYWIARYSPPWAGAFLLFLPIQVIGLLWFEPPSITRDVPWLSGLAIMLISALTLVITVQFYRLGLPWAGRLLPTMPKLEGNRYPALLLGLPASLLVLLGFLPGGSSIIAVAFYGCTYLSLAVFLVGISELSQPTRRSKRLIVALLCQLTLIVLAMLRGSSEIALLFARFSTPVIAGFLTLCLAALPPRTRGMRLAGLILLISAVSICLIAYSANEDNLALLLFSAYDASVSGGDRSSLIGSALAIAGKLVARQDYNEMLRSLTALDYRFLVESVDSMMYPLDSILRLVGLRAYDHPIGQLLFFLRDETRSIDLFPSANIPVGLVVAILARQSVPLLFFVGVIYAFLFSCFLCNDQVAGVSPGRLRLIGLALSGELACLFELTPEFGLQVASMAFACFWGVLMAHALVRSVVSPVNPRLGSGCG